MTDRPAPVPETKASKMRRFSAVFSVRAFLLDSLGGWPQTEEEWEIAYDLWIESRRARILDRQGQANPAISLPGVKAPA